MNRSLIITFAAMAALTVSARQLTPEQALSRALGDAPRAAAIGAVEAPALVYTATLSDEQPMAYVFTQGAGQGYMVVSADDVAVPLLGYADSGTFDADNIPANVQWWLDGYAREIAYAAEREAVAAPTLFSVAAAEETARTPIAPLVTTQWNQDAPYNDQCPTISGKHCMTGCVATAMAQMINYHKYPEKGIGTHSYTSSSNGLSVSFNYGATTFDWANMADYYSSSSTDAQKAAVATLMKACGVAVDMNYGTVESGAGSLWVANALVDYFGFDEATAYQERSWYSLKAWEEIIYNELKNVGPVYYCGMTSTGAGHAFVCDGYSSDGYFHFNWGWGGMSNGYYRLTALDPTSQGIGGSTAGFNYGQAIVTGVQPPKAGSQPEYFMMCYSDLKVGSSSSAVNNANATTAFSTSTGSAVYVGGGFYNMSRTAITNGYLGLKLVNNSTGETTYLADQRYSIGMTWNPINRQTNQFSGSNYMMVMLPSSLASGTYTASAVFRSGNGEWRDIYPYQVNISATPSVARLTMTVSGSSVKFAPPTAAALKVTNVTTLSSLYKGTAYQVKFTITNTGGSEYFGAVRPAFVTSDNKAHMSGEYLVDLMPGESQEITYTGTVPTTLAGGTYKFYICTYDATTGYVETLSNAVSVLVNSSAATFSATYSSFKLLSNPDKTDKNHIEVSATINVTSGYYAGRLSVAIINYTTVSGQTVEILDRIYSPMLFIGAGEERTVTFSGEFAGGEPGKKYSGYLFADFSTQAPLPPVVFTIAQESTGIDDVESAEEDAPVEYFNLQGMPVNPDNLRPGQIYIRRSGTTATKIRY